LSRWEHRIDDVSSLWLQFYYDRADRREQTLDQAIDTFDVEFGHVLPAGPGHRLTWGMHYRHVSDELGFPSPFNLTFVPAQRRTNLVSAFVQDDITLIEDRLFFTVGSKFEHNDFTGFEYQPTGRLLWAIDDRQALWGSISRAVRTPSRFDDDVRLTLASLSPVPPAITLAVFGNRDVESENLLAYEIGYRAQPTDEFSWDASLFYNTYTDLTDFLAGTPIFQPLPPTLIIPRSVTNGVDGETYGVELSTTYAMTPHWNLYGCYSFLQMQLHAAPGLREIKEGDSPHNQIYLRSSWDLPHDFEFDLMTRYVDSLPNRNVGSYISLDLRLGYQIENWEFAVVGQGLLDPHRREFRVQDIVGTEADRAVFAQVTWRH